jgi:hypothetical protein
MMHPRTNPPATPMDAQERAAVKQERARDAALAVQEYEAEKLAFLAKTERLRALRLAHEASTPLPNKAKRPAKGGR